MIFMEKGFEVADYQNPNSAKTEIKQWRGQPKEAKRR